MEKCIEKMYFKMYLIYYDGANWPKTIKREYTRIVSDSKESQFEISEDEAGKNNEKDGIIWRAEIFCQPTPPSKINGGGLVWLILVLGSRVPRESLLVKGDDHLRTFHVGLARWNQIRLVAVLPLEEGSKNG